MNCPRCGKPIADTYDHLTQSEERDYDHLCWRQWGGECEKGDEE